eukprot:3976058-Pleurochrysis_carterae.AAC.3
MRARASQVGFVPASASSAAGGQTTESGPSAAECIGNALKARDTRAPRVLLPRIETLVAAALREAPPNLAPRTLRSDTQRQGGFTQR